MKALSDTYRKNGLDFNLVSRTGDVAIYKQSEPENYFEVFEVQKREAGIFNGKSFQAHESIPSNEQWGQLGFTVYGILAANKKVEELLAKIDRRNLRQR